MARLILSILMIVALFANAGFGAGLTDSLKAGTPELKSAAQLAFGPEGILFVGDSRQAAIFAIATEDVKPAPAGKIEVKGINEKIAAMLGIATDQLLINDVKVNPLSHKVYLAVSRGRGADGVPLILTLDASGKFSEFSLNNVRYSVISLPDVPAPKPDASVKFPEGMSNANLRVRSISDLSYVDGKVLVSGMSNEDFASDLRSIAFPFNTTAEKSTGIRIWHSAHGRYETAAPVDKFIPYKIDNKQYILASYACTPLVKIPVDSLKPGAKVTGSTIAEIGHHNTPLEMFAYSKDGHPYILMAGSTRGVIKLTADNLGIAKPITPPSAQCEASQDANRIQGCDGQIAGVPYVTISELKGVWQMAQLDESRAVVLADRSGSPAAKLVDGQATWFTLDPTATLDLTTIALP
jgi:hypothetical protein